MILSYFRNSWNNILYQDILWNFNTGKLTLSKRTTMCCNWVGTWDTMVVTVCTLSWLSLSRSESMTAVVPMTVRSRRCSERLSDRTRFAPWQETDSRELYKGATDTISLYHMALSWRWLNKRSTLTWMRNSPVSVGDVHLETSLTRLWVNVMRKDGRKLLFYFYN